MSGLARQIDPEELLKQLEDKPFHKASRLSNRVNGAVSYGTPYNTRYASRAEISKFRIPHDGAPADVVHELIKNELDLDGKPNLNLASFVSTFMDPEAHQLFVENIPKNFADADEYPAMMDLHTRCVSIIAHLWGVQKGEKAIGTATTGSSEAIQLGGMAMKRRWKERRDAAGKDSSKPNVIMAANAQVALEKFARYFEVENRILPVSEKSRYGLDPELVKQNIDENTIGVYVILGSTYTGVYEPVEEISKLLDEYEKKTGISIDIHVDAASGGFIEPFVKAETHKWNFELPRVKSINASGHKFGLVYPGLGWIIWRDETYLPKHLIFYLHYLGGVEETFTLNFSRPGSQIIAQYYNLIHFGFTGYKNIMENSLANARLLSRALEMTGWYQCVSDVHRKKGDHKYLEGKQAFISDSHKAADYNAGLPVVAFRFTDRFQKENPHIKQAAVSVLMRARGYIIPNYPLPPHAQNIEILRVVVRESLAADMIDHLVTDLCDVTKNLLQSDTMDLGLWDTSHASVEKEHRTSKSKDKAKSHSPKEKGVYRGVC